MAHPLHQGNSTTGQSTRSLTLPCRVMAMTFVLASIGCRALPSSFAIMLIGDVVSDADVQDRAGELIGKPADAADVMFGERLDTIRTKQDLSVQIYAVPGDLLEQGRFVVDVHDGEIVALSKTQFNSDGVEDVIKEADLKEKLLGKSPAQCRASANLDPPVFKGQSQRTGEDVFVYDVKNWTNLRNARYCVLRFKDNTCQNIRLVGVNATTKDKPDHR